jgi:hypothetical protein
MYLNTREDFGKIATTLQPGNLALKERLQLFGSGKSLTKLLDELEKPASAAAAKGKKE